jgi:hypothetical protein
MIINQLRIFQCLLLVMLISSCASYHNLNENGVNHLGGGFLDNQLAPSLYSLTVKTNFAPWKNFSGAWRAWEKRAKELCGQQNFENIEVQERSYNTIAGEGYVISQIKGYVLCAGNNLEKKEIERLILNNRY